MDGYKPLDEQRSGAQRRQRMWRLFRSAGVLLVWMAALCRPGSAHELVDGELERWCEVVVRDELIQLRYSIGYNARTEAMVAGAINSEPATPPESLAGDTVGVEAAERTELGSDRERWKEALAKYVTQHVQLQVDGVALTAVRSEVVPSGRHPMCWFVALEFAAPQELSSFQLSVVDSAFPTFPGPARQAMRSKSNWDLSESSVAPLLVRAKAEAWTAESDLAPASRPGARIDARLVHAGR